MLNYLEPMVNLIRQYLRHYDVDGSFSEFNISNAHLGGDMFLLGLAFAL